MTKARFKAVLLSLALLGFGALAVAQGAEGGKIVHAGPVAYRVPEEYRPSNVSGTSLFMQFALPDYGPLRRDVHGWEDNVNLLVTRQPAPIAVIYDHQWDGTPIGGKRKWNTIEKTYRVEPGFTVQEMGSGFDIVIPDQDRSTMPLGVMRCGRPKEFMPNAACELMFDRDSQRWKVSFGRQFMARHGEIRASVEAVMDGWRVDEGNGE